MSIIFIYLIVLGYLGWTIYYANQQQLEGLSINHREARTIRNLLYGGVGLIVMLGFFLLTAAATASQMTEEGTAEFPEISTLSLVIGMTVVGISGTAAYAIVQSEGLRFALRDRIAPNRSYDPHSSVHITAIVFCLLISAANIVLYVIAGGAAGAEESAQEVPLLETLLLNGLFIGTAFLGVGYAIRRNGPQSLTRLGLRLPTDDDWRQGLLTALGLFVGFMILGIFLSLLLGDTNNDAAQNQIEAIASTPVLLMLIQLTLVAIGEEIFFRGALQPVFGNVPTSVMFTLLHTQLLASPLIILLAALSLVLGWVRDRYSTTAAIIAHFFYNLLQLGLSLVTGHIIIGGIL